MAENESMTNNIKVTHLKIIISIPACCILELYLQSPQRLFPDILYHSLTPRHEIISYIIPASELLWSDCTRGGVQSSLEDFYQLHVGKIHQLNFKEKPGVLS